MSLCFPLVENIRSSPPPPSHFPFDSFSLLFLMDQGGVGRILLVNRCARDRASPDRDALEWGWEASGPTWWLVLS